MEVKVLEPRQALPVKAFPEGKDRWQQITLQQLQALSTVAATGSATAAARQLGYENLSSFLHHLRRLEELVGVPLVQRRQGQTVITEAGRMLCEAASQVASSMRDVKRKLGIAAQALVAPLRIGGIHSFISLLTEVYGLFTEEWPLNRVVYFIYPRGENVTERVVDNEVDLCLTTTPSLTPWTICEILAVEEVLLVCSPDHPTRSSIELRDVLSQTVVFVREEGTDDHRHALTLLDKLGVSPRILVEVHSRAKIREQVKEGLGIAVLPLASVYQELAQGTLKICNTHGVRVFRQFYSISSKVRPLSQDARLFLAYFSRTVARYSG